MPAFNYPSLAALGAEFPSSAAAVPEACVHPQSHRAVRESVLGLQPSDGEGTAMHFRVGVVRDLEGDLWVVLFRFALVGLERCCPRRLGDLLQGTL